MSEFRGMAVRQCVVRSIVQGYKYKDTRVQRVQPTAFLCSTCVGGYSHGCGRIGCDMCLHHRMSA